MKSLLAFVVVFSGTNSFAEMPCPKITGIKANYPSGATDAYFGESIGVSLTGDALMQVQWSMTFTPDAASTLPKPAPSNFTGGSSLGFIAPGAGVMLVKATQPATTVPIMPMPGQPGGQKACPASSAQVSVTVKPVKIASAVSKPGTTVARTTVVDLTSTRTPETRGMISYKWKKRKSGSTGSWEDLGINPTASFCAREEGKFDIVLEGTSGGVPSSKTLALTVSALPKTTWGPYDYYNHWDDQVVPDIWGMVSGEFQRPPLSVPVCEHEFTIEMKIARNDTLRPVANKPQFTAIIQNGWALASKDANQAAWRYQHRRLPPSKLVTDSGKEYGSVQAWQDAQVEAGGGANVDEIKTAYVRFPMQLGEETGKSPLNFEIYADFPVGFQYVFANPNIWEMGTIMRIRGVLNWNYDSTPTGGARPTYLSISPSMTEFAQAFNMNNPSLIEVPARQPTLFGPAF